MAQTIKIKRSTTTGVPTSLATGELAYSDVSDKLFIGRPGDGTVVAIGGETYINLFPATAGTLEASKLVQVASDKRINEWLVADITIAAGVNTDTIATTTGDLVLAPDSELDINAGTINLTTQATEFKLIDNSATAGTFATGDHTYLTFDTTNSAELIKFGRQVEFSGAYTLPTSLGTSGQALVSNGSTVTFQDVAATLTVDGVDDSSTANVALLTDDLLFDGDNGISASVAKSGTDVTVTIEGTDATTSAKGVASFNSAHFTVASGAVSAKSATSSAPGILRPFAGTGINVYFESNSVVEIEAETASTTSRGIARFDSDNFTVGASGTADYGKVSSKAITLGSSTLDLGSTTTDIAGLTSLVVDDLTINGNTITSGQTNQNISLNPNGSGTVNVNNSRITNVTDPTQAQDAATKAYVDAVKQALDIKDSVRVATTAAITIASDLNVNDTIDGVTLADGDRVLVKNQTDASQNGIYVAGSSPVRAADANTSAEVTSGMFCFVEEGTVNGDNGFVLTTNDTITLDTTDLTFVQFSGAGQIIAGDALVKSGNTINFNDDNITLEVNADKARIKGITATAVGDLLIGAATNGGYSRLVKPSSNNALLTMGTAGTASWTTELDGGTF